MARFPYRVLFFSVSEAFVEFSVHPTGSRCGTDESPAPRPAGPGRWEDGDGQNSARPRQRARQGSSMHIEINFLSRSGDKLSLPEKSQKDRLAASLRVWGLCVGSGCSPSQCLLCTGPWARYQPRPAKPDGCGSAASISRWGRADSVPCLLLLVLSVNNKIRADDKNNLSSE